jgi:hypothetical protein
VNEVVHDAPGRTMHEGLLRRITVDKEEPPACAAGGAVAPHWENLVGRADKDMTWPDWRGARVATHTMTEPAGQAGGQHGNGSALGESLFMALIAYFVEIGYTCWCHKRDRHGPGGV